eukprot:6162602-Pleurochrysis_carterae.AAC.1
MLHDPNSLSILSDLPCRLLPCQTERVYYIAQAGDAASVSACAAAPACFSKHVLSVQTLFCPNVILTTSIHAARAFRYSYKNHVHATTKGNATAL